jgi:hypothetical protein
MSWYACRRGAITTAARSTGVPVPFGAAIRSTAIGSVTNGGLKTRNFDQILREVDQAFEIHRPEGSTSAEPTSN